MRISDGSCSSYPAADRLKRFSIFDSTIWSVLLAGCKYWRIDQQGLSGASAKPNSYFFAAIYHLLHNSLHTLVLWTHARAGSHGSYGFIQRCRLVGVRHLALSDCLLPLSRAVDFELPGKSVHSLPARISSSSVPYSTYFLIAVLVAPRCSAILHGNSVCRQGCFRRPGTTLG